MGVRKYVNVMAPPHPTPPLRDVTHLQRSMTYVRTCKWTCRGVTSWEVASTWTLLPHPTPPQGTYKKMPKTLGRFSTRRHEHPFTSYFDVHQGYQVLTHCHMITYACQQVHVWRACCISPQWPSDRLSWSSVAKNSVFAQLRCRPSGKHTKSYWKWPLK